MPTNECRCGHTGGGPHPCHARGYTCRRPAMAGLIAMPLTPISGVQDKCGAYQTWACEEHWAEFRAINSPDPAISGPAIRKLAANYPAFAKMLGRLLREEVAR